MINDRFVSERAIDFDEVTSVRRVSLAARVALFGHEFGIDRQLSVVY